MKPTRLVLLTILLALALPAAASPAAAGEADPPPPPTAEGSQPALPPAPEGAPVLIVAPHPEAPAPAPVDVVAPPLPRPPLPAGALRPAMAPGPERPPAPEASQETPRPPAPARAPRAPAQGSRTQLFQVAMLAADVQDGGDLDGNTERDPPSAFKLGDLPPGVRKAVSDLGDFLPYKHYHLLDTTLIRTADRGIATLKDYRSFYNVEMRFRPGDRTLDEPELMIQRFDIVRIPGSPATHVEIEGKDGTKRSEERPQPPPKVIVSSSFGMSVGETLVVGTSRIDGTGTALIFLVTAAR